MTDRTLEDLVAKKTLVDRRSATHASIALGSLYDLIGGHLNVTQMPVSRGLMLMFNRATGGLYGRFADNMNTWFKGNPYGTWTEQTRTAVADVVSGGLFYALPYATVTAAVKLLTDSQLDIDHPFAHVNIHEFLQSFATVPTGSVIFSIPTRYYMRWRRRRAGVEKPGEYEIKRAEATAATAAE